MTPTQYRNALARVGLSIVGAARFFGVSPRQAQRFAAGDADIPEGFARLLRLMVRLDLSAADVP